ncbi:MAG: hypothetical protein ACRDHE_09385 [Ktedonobacterales bacterium]
MFKEVFTSRRPTGITPTELVTAENPYIERVTLPDGHVIYVARGSLAAAKSVVAARKLALRRMEERRLAEERAAQRTDDAPIRERRAS